MKEKILNIILLLCIFIPVCLLTIKIYNYVGNDKKIEELTIENERLRSFNVRRERRLKWMTEPKAINLESVSLGYHLLGIKPEVLASLLYCENGPEFVETGSIDKTDYFAQHFPLDKWSALDGSRTLNRYLWDWLLEDKKRAKDFFIYAAKPYTNLSEKEQKSWANNMIAAEERFRKDIRFSGKSDKSIVMAMRTPTAVIPGKSKIHNKSKTVFTKPIKK